MIPHNSTQSVFKVPDAIDVCTVGKNNIRQMMIKYIGKTYSASMDFGSDPADTYEIFRKLNESYMQHIRKMRLNV